MSTKYPRVSLFNTEDRRVYSTIVGREYQVAVSLPLNYATSTQTYPVIYVLDGDVFLGVASNMTPFLNWGSGIPEAIVVGIGYDIENFDQWGIQRELDFKIPAVKDAPADSYADRFLAAITQEIIPFVEANYRATAADRTLFGYSSGGFFVLYALFHQPDAFRAYLAGSGDLYISCPYMLAHDQALAARTKTDTLQVYITVGSLEDDSVPFYHELTSAMRTRNYPGVCLTTEIYEGEAHGFGGLLKTYIQRLVYTFPVKK